MRETDKRLQVKRFNEGIKLGATFLNGVAIANVIVVILARCRRR